MKECLVCLMTTHDDARHTVRVYIYPTVHVL